MKLDAALDTAWKAEALRRSSAHKPLPQAWLDQVELWPLVKDRPIPPHYQQWLKADMH
jgi:hypothetical protein